MKKISALLLGLTSALAIAGPEPLPPTSLTVDFGSAALSGAGRLIKAMNVPVANGSSTTYYNADLEFQFLSDGRLAAVVSSASVASGPALSNSSSILNFVAGTYKEVERGCLYTLSAGGIGNDGSRTYSLTKNDNTCLSGQIWPAYSFSTAPVMSNPFVLGTTAQRALYPTDGAYGLHSNGGGVRAAAAGTTIVITGYYTSDGAPAGGSANFVKQ